MLAGIVSLLVVGGQGDNYDNDGATGINALAAGIQAKASGLNSVAVGFSATATTDASAVFGSGASVGAAKTTALGASARAEYEYSVALGNSSYAGAAVLTPSAVIAGKTYTFAGGAPLIASTVSVGLLGVERTITNVAAGRISATSTDAINGSQLHATNTALEALADDALLWDPAANGGAGAYSANHGGTGPNKITDVADGDVNATSTDAINGSQLFAVAGDTSTTYITNNGVGVKYVRTNDTGLTPDDAHASAQGATAVGYNAQASAVNSLALGNTAAASAVGDIAIGKDAKADGAIDTSGNTGNAIAIGSDSSALTYDAIALGRAAKAYGSETVALGPMAVSGNAGDPSAVKTTAVGFAATANAGYAVAMGSSATATGFSSVAIGNFPQVSGADSVGIGTWANVSAAQSVALGAYNNVSGAGGSAVIGRNNTVANARTFVLGNGVTTTQDSSVVLGDASTDRAATTETGVTLNGTAYTFAGQGSAAKGVVSVGAAGAERQIINVAAGRLSATSTDAVNGSQLFATNTAVDMLSTTVTNLGNDALLWDTGLGAFSAAHGASPTNKITNVAAGDVNATSTDAINGSQLFAVAGDTSTTYITNNGAGVKYVRTNDTGLPADDAHASAQGATAVGYNAQASAADSLALGRGSVARNAGAVALGSGSVTAAAVGTAGATIAGTAYSFAGIAPTSTVSVGAVGAERTVTNVAAGRLSATSTDVVNGSQLFATNTAVDALNTTVTNIQNGGGIKYFHTNSTGADSSAAGTDSTAIGPAAVASGASSIATGNNAKAQADNTVALGANATATSVGDVALGSGSVTQAAVQTSTMVVNGTTYSVAGTATSTVSVGDAGAERTITNVAAGRVNGTSTDAINGSQLYATNQAIASIGAAASNAVLYDTDSGGRTNSVTLQGGDPNAPVVLHNVGPGVAGTDGVNVNQLKDSAASTLASANTYTDNRTAYAITTANTYTDAKSAQTLSSANAYTDQKFDMLSGALGDVQKEARQAAAIGLAAASLRYDDRPGKVSAAIGGGAWRGQGALAMGVGYTSDDQRVRANLSATTAGGHWGVGGGLTFTLN